MDATLLARDCLLKLLQLLLLAVDGRDKNGFPVEGRESVELCVSVRLLFWLLVGRLSRERLGLWKAVEVFGCLVKAKVLPGLVDLCVDVLKSTSRLESINFDSLLR